MSVCHIRGSGRMKCKRKNRRSDIYRRTVSGNAEVVPSQRVLKKPEKRNIWTCTCWRGWRLALLSRDDHRCPSLMNSTQKTPAMWQNVYSSNYTLTFEFYGLWTGENHRSDVMTALSFQSDVCSPYCSFLMHVLFYYCWIYHLYTELLCTVLHCYDVTLLPFILHTWR